VIQAVELRKRYGDTEAVRGVSFTVEKGRVVGLLGPNGAGKTTIMKILTGYHFATEGRALVDGVDVAEDPVAVKRRVGYLPESAPLYPDMSPAEILDWAADARAIDGPARRAAIERVVESCGIAEVFHRPVEQLSKGYRQRLGLAQAILHDPDILILDEPTTGLDPNQILEIRSLIRKLGGEKTVILSTHILQEVEAVCSDVLILNEGLIAAQGRTEEIGEALKGEERLELRLRPRRSGGGPREVEAALARIPGLKARPRVEAEASGILSVGLVMAPGGEPGELVFDWAVEEGIAILELARHRLSLEEIFVKLTAEGGTP
jgi:ABC-2 type transport system ATP-binding protein